MSQPRTAFGARHVDSGDSSTGPVVCIIRLDQRSGATTIESRVQGGQNEGVHIQHGTSGIPGSRSPLKSGLYYSSLMCFSQQVLSSTMKFLRSWWSTRKRGNPLPTSSPRALPLDAYVVPTLTLLPRTCAIVGGVLTVASILDSVLFATGRHLKKTGTSSSNGNGHPSGKLM